MKRKILGGLIFGALSIIVLFTAVSVIYNLLAKQKLTFVQLIGNGTVWTIVIVLVMAAVLVFLANYKPKVGSRVLKVNDALEDSHFMTKREMRAAKDLTVTKLSKLSEINDNMPIFAEQTWNKKDVDIVLAKAIHTLVVGATGTGKTTGFVDPVMQILPRTKTKPSLVITDPKGEIYKHHATMLEEQGYKIYVIDLKDIYHSVKWNPFAEVIRKTEIIKNPTEIEEKNGKYYYDGIEYLSLKQAETERAVYLQQIEDEIYQDIQDIIYTACPVTSSGDGKSWEEGAQSFIFGIMLAFWEDLRDGLMEPHQFNLYNVFKNISLYSNGDIREFKEFFDRRDKKSNARGPANTVLVSQDRTLTSYLGEVNKHINWLTDKGVASFTSENEINLSEFDEEPAALFLKITDSVENRYRLVTLFVTQMYKALVAKAGRNELSGKTADEALMRNVYFIMDEFGNLPKFNKLDSIITIGRSRKIFMIPVIQSYAQLENKYGKEISEIVKANCAITVFIGTTDKQTIEEISEKCGKKKVKSVSFSEQKDMSVSTSASERPLIYPSELSKLNNPPQIQGNAIVLSLGRPPLRARFTPPFKLSDIYDMGDERIKKGSAALFDEERYFYDIVKRNRFIEECEILEESRAENEDAINDWIAGLISEDEQSEGEDESKAKYSEMQKRLNDKINTFKDRLSETAFQILKDCQTEDIPSCVDLILDELYENGGIDSFLSFDLINLKVYVQDYLKKEIHEKGAEI